MKNLCCVFLVLVFFSCSKSIQRPSSDVSDNLEPVRTLLDHIQSQAGVIVNGDGVTASIYIRGIGQSFVSNSSPLYVLNGVVMGKEFSSVYYDVRPVDIKSVRVLKEPSELSSYGIRGANGVILIKTKGTTDHGL